MIQAIQTLAERSGEVWDKLNDNPKRVYFPNFGDGDNVLRSGIDIDRVMFTIPGTNFKIYWYGFLIAAGIVLALIYGFKKMKKVGIDPDRATDAVIGGFFGAIIGARLYYIIFSDTSITKFFDFRDGGLAIYGGVIGAILVGGYITKRKKLRLMTMLDVAAPCFFIGQAIGRWGNFFNQECFGTNTDKPWGMMSLTTANYVSDHITDGSVDPTLPIHPCFLYESLWCIAGFVFLHLFFKHRKFDGEIFLCYTGWYGLGRFFIEGLRTDSLYIGSVRASQLLAGLCFVASVAAIIVIRVRIHKFKDYVFFKDTELSREMILQYDNLNRFEKERRELKSKISEAKKNGEDAAELEKQYEEQFGETAKKARQEALDKAEQADIKAAAERKAARAELVGKPADEKGEPKTEETKPEEKKSEPKAENTKTEEKKGEPKAEETKPEEKKTEPKAEETKPEEKKSEPKAEETKPKEKKGEPKAEDTKSEEKKTEPKAEETKTEEKKDLTKPQQDQNKNGANQGQKKNNNYHSRNNRGKNRNKNKNSNGGNKQGGQQNNKQGSGNNGGNNKQNNNANSKPGNNKQGGGKNKNNNNNKTGNNKSSKPGNNN